MVEASTATVNAGDARNQQRKHSQRLSVKTCTALLTVSELSAFTQPNHQMKAYALFPQISLYVASVFSATLPNTETMMLLWALCQESLKIQPVYKLS